MGARYRVGIDLKYRADIDGLRAIAVTAVIAYHAWASLLPGGFVGVDVFFVISGFLITGILTKEYRTSGRIDFAMFYARRVRRLLPALILMIAATLCAGLVFMPAIGDLQNLGKSAASALLFASNLFFVKQHSGYFEAASETFPLLHTWTLAVEEQFYIVWPVLLVLAGWATRRMGLAFRTGLILMFAAIMIVSFAISLYATRNYPNYAFFLTPFRAWEFAIGAALTLWLARSPATGRATGAALGIVGLVLIAGAAAVLDRGTAFPGFAALLPTLGAAALLAAGAIAPTNAVSRTLARQPFVYIGKISYGWYLWHWPYLAIVRGVTLGEATPWQIALAVLASFVTSALSYHLVEEPIRHQRVGSFRTTPRSLVAGAVLIAVGVAAALGTTAIANQRLAASPRLTAIANALANDGDPIVPGCRDLQAQFTRLLPVEPCLLGSAKSGPLLILWGDSHSGPLVGLLDTWGKREGIAVLPRVRGGCRPMLDAALTIGVAPSDHNRRNCGAYRDAVRRQIAELAKRRPVTVLVVSRWPDTQVRETVEADPTQMPTLLRDSMDALVADAQAGRYRLALAKDTPLMPHDVPRCLAMRSVAECGLPRAMADRMRDEANAEIDRVAAADPTIAIIDPIEGICDGQACLPVRRGTILYFDTGHLSNRGAASLAPAIADQLKALAVSARMPMANVTPGSSR